jgi:hypothetical protein
MLRIRTQAQALSSVHLCSRCVLCLCQWKKDTHYYELYRSLLLEKRSISPFIRNMLYSKSTESAAVRHQEVAGSQHGIHQVVLLV